MGRKGIAYKDKLFPSRCPCQAVVVAEAQEFGAAIEIFRVAAPFQQGSVPCLPHRVWLSEQQWHISTEIRVWLSKKAPSSSLAVRCMGTGQSKGLSALRADISCCCIHGRLFSSSAPCRSYSSSCRGPG